jgi:DNA polymerase-1
VILSADYSQIELRIMAHLSEDAALVHAFQQGHDIHRATAAERAAINAPMQGTAADLIKLAMIEVQRWLDAGKLATRLVLQVHDELVFEVPDGEVEQVKRELPGLMSGVSTLSVPLVVDVGIGNNWDEAH